MLDVTGIHGVPWKAMGLSQQNNTDGFHHRYRQTRLCAQGGEPSYLDPYANQNLGSNGEYFEPVTTIGYIDPIIDLVARRYHSTVEKMPVDLVEFLTSFAVKVKVGLRRTFVCVHAYVNDRRRDRFIDENSRDTFPSLAVQVEVHLHGNYSLSDCGDSLSLHSYTMLDHGSL